MSTSLYRQFDLVEGARTTTVWLEDDPRLKVGVRMTAKETGARMWTVLKKYKTLRSVDDITEHRRWRVGGLA